MIRDCYTCLHAPPWQGPGSPADCWALTGDESADKGVIDFCGKSGVNDEDSDRPGWPREGNTVNCPLWVARGAR